MSTGREMNPLSGADYCIILNMLQKKSERKSKKEKEEADEKDKDDTDQKEDKETKSSDEKSEKTKEDSPKVSEVCVLLHTGCAKHNLLSVYIFYSGSDYSSYLPHMGAHCADHQNWHGKGRTSSFQILC